MRIAFLVHRFPEVSETFIVRQIAGLIELGHEVHIYSERSPHTEQPVHPEIDHYCLRDFTTYLDVDMPVESGYWSMPAWPLWGRTWLPGAEQPVFNARRLLRAVPTFLASLAAQPHLAMQVVQSTAYGEQALTLEALYHLATLRKRAAKYDVIHAHFGTVASNLRFARDLWRAPLVTTFHGYDYCSVPRQRGLHCYRSLFRAVDAVTIHSEYGQKRLLALGCDSSKLRRLHVGLIPEQFPYLPRAVGTGQPIRILTVARLVEIKGVRYAIEAIAKLRSRGHHVRYDVVGDGPERANLEAQIAQLGLREVIHLHGAQDTRRVSEIMAQSHLFLLPSINVHGDEEGTPVSLMEAQASGMPVVASATGGIPEVIRDGHSGFLFPERNVDTLVERLAFLTKHRELWPEMGACGREHVESQFDIRKLSRELVSIYEATVAATKNALN